VLYRLFDKYPYDTKKPFALQYPRVALTVVSAPPNHAQLQQHDFGGGFIPGNGCWTLRAKVWLDTKASQDVGPFQWCSPQDLPKDYQPDSLVTITPCDGCRSQSVTRNTPTGSALAMQRGTRNRLLFVAGVSGFEFYEWLSTSQNYAAGADTTGTLRTEGPVPPDCAVPTDVAHKRYFASNTGQFDITLNDGAMVRLIFDAMDYDLSNHQDRRAWIVAFLPAQEPEASLKIQPAPGSTRRAAVECAPSCKSASRPHLAGNPRDWRARVCLAKRCLCRSDLPVQTRRRGDLRLWEPAGVAWDAPGEERQGRSEHV
jgi:hypothetical protein